MLLLKNGRVIDPDSGTDGKLDVLIEDGTISRIDRGITAEGASEIDMSKRFRTRTPPESNDAKTSKTPYSPAPSVTRFPLPSTRYMSAVKDMATSPASAVRPNAGDLRCLGPCVDIIPGYLEPEPAAGRCGVFAAEYGIGQGQTQMAELTLRREEHERVGRFAVARDRRRAFPA